MFSPAGDKLVSGSRDKTIIVWDLQTHKALDVCPEHKGAVSGVAISRDGTRMASGCSASTIKFWDMADLKKSLKTIVSHKSAIRSLAFSPDGKTLASGGVDHTTTLLHLAPPPPIASLTIEIAIRLDVFAPDGDILVIATR